MTKNKLSDLNDHLFAQIERLSDENLKGEALEQEAKRGAAIVAAADQVIRMASLQVQAAKIMSDHGLDPTKQLAGLEGKQTPQLRAIEGKKA